MLSGSVPPLPQDHLGRLRSARRRGDVVGAGRSEVHLQHSALTVRPAWPALLQSLATNRALVDGNKRTAFVATALFYELNGHHVPGDPEDELFELVIAVATGKLASIHEIAHLLAPLVE